jgi:hypothetical protein
VPKDVTEVGIVSEDNDEHPSKQLLPKDVTKAGIVSDDNDEHPLKQLLPKDVTEAGIITFLRFLQFRKQLSWKMTIAFVNFKFSINLSKIMSFPLSIS